MSPWNIVWLASYPKSGNTWFRIFLTNYLRNSDSPAEINELGQRSIASARSEFETCYGIDSRDLNADEIDQLRPAMYNQWQTRTGLIYYKVHDAYTYLDNHQPLLGNPIGQAAIYFIRNPLDVAVSFAHHRGEKNLDHVICDMADINFCLNGSNDRDKTQIRQKLLSWSDHVTSWLNARIPVHVMRYEDMHTNTLMTFANAMTFLGFTIDLSRLEKAITFSNFDQLKKQETVTGFKEKSRKAETFFRKGQIGSYRKSLSMDQIESIQSCHYKTMTLFGYINS